MKSLTTFDILNLTYEQKMNGVFFSGVKGEGEYKKWWSNGQLQIHTFYKNNKLNGEFKKWFSNGQLWIHCFFIEDKTIGEYKRWDYNGKLIFHYYYNNKKNKILNKIKRLLTWIK